MDDASLSDSQTACKDLPENAHSLLLTQSPLSSYVLPEGFSLAELSDDEALPILIDNLLQSDHIGMVDALQGHLLILQQTASRIIFYRGGVDDLGSERGFGEVIQSLIDSPRGSLTQQVAP